MHTPLTHRIGHENSPSSICECHLTPTALRSPPSACGCINTLQRIQGWTTPNQTHQRSSLFAEANDDAVVHDVDDVEEEGVVENGSMEDGLAGDETHTQQTEMGE